MGADPSMYWYMYASVHDVKQQNVEQTRIPDIRNFQSGISRIVAGGVPLPTPLIATAFDIARKGLLIVAQPTPSTFIPALSLSHYGLHAIPTYITVLPVVGRLLESRKPR